MVESGRLANGSPFVQFGSGEKNVCILPGYEGELLNTPAHPLLARLMLRGFAAENCTVRYVGRKPNTPEKYTTRDMANDYASVVRPDTHIIGISLGGMVAQHLAALSNDIKTMTLCNSGPDDSERAEANLSMSLERASAGDWRGFHTGITWDVDSWLQKQLSYVGISIERMLNQNYRSEVIHGGQAAVDHSCWDRLEDIDIPTFLVTGTADESYPPAILKEAAAKLDRARLEIVESDHEYFYSDTADFYRRWRNFLESA